ncbi:MAG: AAA family ATPase [Dehalococcoidia bacterium]|nr:AAA family ATPase [Dehalococcoidia bacterium]
MTRSYTVAKGVYTFPGETAQLQLRVVQRGRYGQLFALATFLTPDGKGVLAQGRGDLSAPRFQHEIAAQAAQRNSRQTAIYEDAILAASLALQNDPDVSPALPPPAIVRCVDFIKGVRPSGPAVVDGLLERGGLYGLASKPKCGKTLLAMNLAVDVSRGNPWLGRPTRQGRAILFQLEDSERTLKKRLEAMTGGSFPQDLWIHATPFKLAPETYDATVEACRGASLIICDPIIQAGEVQDWNSQAEVRGTYDLWRRLARDTDAAVVVAAHHRKMSGDFGDQMAGSIQAQATVDGILELYRDSHLEKLERKLSFTGRDWADKEYEVIRLDPTTLTWTCSGTFKQAMEAEKEVRRAEKREEVLASLPDAAPGLTYEQLEATTGLGRNRIRDSLEALGNRVAKGGKPRSPRDPLRFWRAA